jgi:hypothetical protein
MKIKLKSGIPTLTRRIFNHIVHSDEYDVDYFNTWPIKIQLVAGGLLVDVSVVPYTGRVKIQHGFNNSTFLNYLDLFIEPQHKRLLWYLILMIAHTPKVLNMCIHVNTKGVFINANMYINKRNQNENEFVLHLVRYTKHLATNNVRLTNIYDGVTENFWIIAKYSKANLFRELSVKIPLIIHHKTPNRL